MVFTRVYSRLLRSFITAGQAAVNIVRERLANLHLGWKTKYQE